MPTGCPHAGHTPGVSAVRRIHQLCACRPQCGHASIGRPGGTRFRHTQQRTSSAMRTPPRLPILPPRLEDKPSDAARHSAETRAPTKPLRLQAPTHQPHPCPARPTRVVRGSLRPALNETEPRPLPRRCTHAASATRPPTKKQRHPFSHTNSQKHPTICRVTADITAHTFKCDDQGTCGPIQTPPTQDELEGSYPNEAVP